MTDKRTHDEYKDRTALQRAGWDVSKGDSIRFNAARGGSETVAHFVCKALAGYVLAERGWRIDSEVEMPGGEVDILAYGTAEKPLVVEVETDVTQTVIDEKLDQYWKDEPIRDVFFLDPTEMPGEIDAAKEWVEGQL